MSLLVYLLYLFVGGLLIGGLARLFVPGTGGLGVVATVLAGLAGAFLGGLVTRYLVDPREDWVGLLIAVLCAAGLIALMAPGRARA